MPESMTILLGLLFLVVTYILTQFGVAWRIQRAKLFVIKDLKLRQALDANSAVELPYATRKFVNIGTRDFRPRALQELEAKKVIGATQHSKYYLRKSYEEAQRLLSGNRAQG